MAKPALMWSVEDLESTLQDLVGNALLLYPDWPVGQVAEEALKMAEPDFVNAYSRVLILRALAKAVREQRKETRKPKGRRRGNSGHSTYAGSSSHAGTRGGGSGAEDGEDPQEEPRQGVLFPGLNHLPDSINPDSTLVDVRAEITRVKHQMRDHIRRLEEEVEAARREQPPELVDLEALAKTMVPYARRNKGITVGEVAKRISE